MAPDLDGDGGGDLVMGVPLDAVNGPNAGVLVVGAIDGSGTVSRQRILFEGIEERASTGRAIALLGDADGNGLDDLAVGMPLADGGGRDKGGVEILFLWEDGSVHGQLRVDKAHGIALDDYSNFGGAIARIPDLNDDKISDLAVGAPGDQSRGAIWLLSTPRTQPPEITNTTVSPKGIPSLDDQIQVAARISGSIADARLQIRRGAESQPSSIPMELIDGLYRATIPPALVSSLGAEYRIEVDNTNGLRARDPNRGFYTLRFHVPDGEHFTVRHGSEASGYRLLSIPFELTDNSARSLFQAELGQYDDREWRFFGQADDGLVELDETDIQIAPGRAYWLIVKDRDHVFNTGSATTIPTDEPFRVPMREGWNMVGNPFDYDLPVSSLVSAAGHPLDVRRYDSGGCIPEFDRIEPFKGYIVAGSSTTTDTLLIYPRPPDETTPAGDEKTGTAKIRVMITKGESHDKYNYAVLSQDDTLFRPGMNRMEPPAVGDYVRLAFECDRKTACTSGLSEQAKLPLQNGTTWSLAISSASAGRAIVRFDGISDLPATLTPKLVDPDAGIALDLRQTPEYPVALQGKSFVKRLHLVVSSIDDDREGRMPDLPNSMESQFLDAFPNPFAGSVTVGYTISHRSKVQINVYDLLGRKLTSIVDRTRHPDGVFAEVWDPGDAPPGVYLLTLSVGNRRLDTRAVTLTR
jgi:hypothetical protein